VSSDGTVLLLGLTPSVVFSAKAGLIVTVSIVVVVTVTAATCEVLVPPIMLDVLTFEVVKMVEDSESGV